MKGTQRKWVNTKVVLDIESGDVLRREGYWYEGPWALAHDVFAPDVSHFRFYEDGTESGSVPAAAEDTNVSNRDVSAGDSQIHIRLMVDELGAGSIPGAATDDYDLEFNINAVGWVIPTGATTGIQLDTASSLTDAAATTNRTTDGLTNGAGTFIAGEQCDANAQVTDFLHSADNYTEHVWALLLVSADLNNGDSIDFRLSYNGGNPGMDNTQVPNVTILKTAAGPAAGLRTLALAGVGV